MSDHSKELREIINQIQVRDRKHVLAIMQNEDERMRKAPGGLYKHQNWKGGYVDHVLETMKVACLLYETLSSQRRLPFGLSDALYVLFLHDLEKMYKTTTNKAGRPMRTLLAEDPNYHSAKIIVQRLKIPLTKMQLNALMYVEGEKNDYHPTKRVMNPLAAFVHCCDTISARIWFDEPRKSGLMSRL